MRSETNIKIVMYPVTSIHKPQGLVVQSIVSLTSSLRGQLVKCLPLYNQIHFFKKKMREAYAVAKASHIFSTKILAYLRY